MAFLNPTGASRLIRARAAQKTDQNPALLLINSLRTVLIQQLCACELSRQSYALLDFPNHANVGDSAIWLGEVAYLKDVLGSFPSFVCEHTNFDPDLLRKALPSGPIFLSGGGNFGDVWPKHQRFRESVIQQFPDRHIIQLPQTIQFANSALIERTANIIKRHSNFVLFVRDRRSFEVARSVFDCPVQLAPDMAFHLGAIQRPVSATCRLLLLLRMDKESAQRGISLPLGLAEGVVVANWREEDPKLLIKMKCRTALLSLLKLRFKTLSKSKCRELLFRSLARQRVSRGTKLLSSADYVITDHLHCHILCVLLGIPHIVLENSYGKLGSFIETWTKDCGLVRAARSLHQAIELWRQSDSRVPQDQIRHHRLTP
jgi:pyruvyl transferase EpsO